VSGAYDATTAEKLEGTSRGVKADSLPHPSVPHLPLLLHPRFTHSLLYSSFPSLLNRARRFGENLLRCCPRYPAKKTDNRLQNLAGTKRTLHPPRTISEVGRDASHGSHISRLRLCHCSPATFTNALGRAPTIISIYTANSRRAKRQPGSRNRRRSFMSGVELGDEAGRRVRLGLS